MSLILAIDPGPVRSAWVALEVGGPVLAHALEPNDEVLGRMPPYRHNQFWSNRDGHPDTYDSLAIEMIASYGMPVGAEIFETCVWIGRFVQAWGGDYSYVLRKDVKLHLCGTTRAKDSNIRQALIDKLGPPGLKASPGPTYGIHKDEWAALAVAVTYLETQERAAPTKHDPPLCPNQPPE